MGLTKLSPYLFLVSGYYMSRKRREYEDEYWVDTYEDIILDNTDLSEYPNEINNKYSLVHAPDVDVEDVRAYGICKYQYKVNGEHDAVNEECFLINQGKRDEEIIESLKEARRWK